MKRILCITLGSLILVFMCAFPPTAVYALGNTEEPEFQVDKDGQNTSESKSARDMAEEFLADKRWQEGENFKSNGESFYVGIGEGSIQAPISHPRYLQARINAFEKAFLASKQELAEFLGTDIESKILKQYIEGNELDKPKDTGSNSEGEPTILDKVKVLANAKLDKMIEKEGVNPKAADNEEIEEALAGIVSKEEFKRLTKTLAKTYLSGLQVFKCFEGPGEGQGYQIAVVTIYSDKLREMASSIFTGEKPKSRAPKKSIQKQIPADKDVLLQTFGIQQKIDENGDLVIVAFAQGAPRTASSNSVSMAYRKAKNAAMGYIRSFAGENYMTTSDAINAESTTEFDDNTKSYQDESEFEDVINSYSKKLNVAGIKTIKKWKHKHPITGKTVAGVVMAWSPKSAGRAKMLRKQMDKSSRVSDRSAASSISSAPGRHKLDHAGVTGSGAEADEDAF